MQGEAAAAAMGKLVGSCLRLSEAAQVATCRAQRLFFLNESQSLSSFLVLDLGILLYPEYQVHCSRSAFASRQALLDYERALHHAAALDNALEVCFLDMIHA